MKHNRFNEQHRDTCQSCREAYLDFIQEQNDDARLDALAAEIEIELAYED